MTYAKYRLTDSILIEDTTRSSRLLYTKLVGYPDDEYWHFVQGYADVEDEVLMLETESPGGRTHYFFDPAEAEAFLNDLSGLAPWDDTQTWCWDVDVTMLRTVSTRNEVRGNLTSELHSFGLRRWDELAAFAFSQAATPDRRGFVLFGAALDIPRPELDMVPRPETGTARVLVYGEGPIWVDASDRHSFEMTDAALTAPRDGTVTVAWEFEPDRLVWTQVTGPTTPLDATLAVTYPLWQGLRV